MSKLHTALQRIGLAATLLLSPAMAPAATSAGAGTARPLALSAADPALQWGPCPPVFPGPCEIAVLQGDPAKPNADVFLRIGPGHALPAHTHSSAERMVLVAGELAVKYKGVAQVVLTPGSYAYGPAGLPHRAHCQSKEPCTLFIAFEGPVDAVAHAGGVD
jgi:quercetin dioxygenase-like cupin family protein